MGLTLSLKGGEYKDRKGRRMRYDSPLGVREKIRQKRVKKGRVSESMDLRQLLQGGYRKSINIFLFFSYFSFSFFSFSFS